MAKAPAQKIGFWHMVRDVLIASMNKGQFPLALFGMILVVLIWSMPPADVSLLVFQVIDDLKRGYLFGYALAAGTASGWFVHAKFQRRVITEEMRRIGNERSSLQKRELGAKVKSSATRKK
jgi:hypothetical protein